MTLIGRGVFACAMLPWSGRAAAPTALPVPCVAGSCGANAAGFVSSGAATAVQTGKNLTVSQTSKNAALNWSSFNIGADGKVVFKQPSSSSIALNRIYDANPSSIFGTLSANGQIYLINANGFLFGSSAKVNVAGLLASSLNISDQTFGTGILAALAQQNTAALQNTDNAGNPIVDSSGNALLNTGTITVQTGAQLNAAGGGRLLLAAPTVSNAGTLTAPDGQIILAAGQKVYLQASSKPELRGLIVEVDGGGKVSNQLAGLLSAARGDITLVGLAVNQDGRISATTSVSANGSVTLTGADGFSGGGGLTSPNNGGTVELGANSSIDILPEYGDTTTAVDAQKQLQSSISITGKQVFMHGGSIDAPSAALSVIATANPVAGATDYNPDSRIRIDAGTTINLAGSQAELPMSANLVTVQLRSNEFANDPTQRNGALRGDTVTVDMRAAGGKGTPIADVSSAIAAVGKNIAQRTSTGGTASFLSAGDIVFNPGASVNVSGGATTYQGGAIQTTSLVGANGQLYDIGSANPLQTYTGVVNPTFTQAYDKWGVKEVISTPGLSHFESGYVQGAAAGGIQFAAPSLALRGVVQGSAVSGRYQRGPIGTAFGDAPAGGTLTIGVAGGVNSALHNANPLATDFFAPGVTVTANPFPIVVADDATLPVQTLQLPVSYLTDGGFTTTQIYSNTNITLPAGLPLQLTPGASLLFEASRVDVNSSIEAPAGHLSFESLLTVANPSLNGRMGVGIGNGVTFDVSGRYTNDGSLIGGVGTAQTLQDAGSIALQLSEPGSELVLGNGVALKADGGAWVTPSGSITYGAGGDITLDASPAQAALQFGRNTVIEAFGVGTAAGGSFSLTAPRINISQGAGAAWTAAQRVDDLMSTGQVLNLYAPLFANYGFSSVNLTATGPAESSTTSDVLTVAAGTTINAQMRSWSLQPGYQNVATGGRVSDFSRAVTLPQYARLPTNVSLSVLRLLDGQTLGSANYGDLDVQAGASILADPAASIVLTSEGSIAMGGTLRAQGGNIALKIVSPADVIANPALSDPLDPGYRPTQGIDLARTAVLDVSGTTVLTPNTQGLLQGQVLAGGSLSLLAHRGTVVAETGSSMNISGTSAALDIGNLGAGGGYTRAVVASAGGSLTVSSGESISLLGSLNAHAGVGNTGNAAAGSLEVDLIRSEGLPSNAVPLPGSSLQIELVDNTSGSSRSAPDSNVAILGAQQIQQSGIDSLTLKAGGQSAHGSILFDALAPLHLARQFVMDSPSVTVAGGINAVVSAPLVQIGNSIVVGDLTTPPAPTPGTGTLSVSAQQINLFGNFSIGGTSKTTLSSSGDVQLQGTNTDATPTGPQIGSLTTSGNLAINAARVYPDTYTDFTIRLPEGTGTSVSIGQTSASPGSPLSAGGALSISADKVSISGTLLAPFGHIDLSANESLTLADGSLVSVSGAGLTVPFGRTQLNGAEWIYATENGSLNPITGVPTKQVTLTAPNITMQSAATVNVQGGGDLYAYEWVPGTGGLHDSLVSSGSDRISGLYAILPSTRGQAAPYDPQESASFGPTQTVYLSGGAGIAAGYYALLPPRYALEPGAYLVQMQPGYVSVGGGKIGALADGTPVLAGYLSAGATGLHTGLTEYQGFAIYPGSYGQQLAAYTVSNASSYFAAAAAAAGTGPVPVPADAGMFTLSVLQSLTNSLSLQGSVLTAAAKGGRGAQVNISAPDLEIVSGDESPAAGVVAVSGSVIQSWNASEILLGGTSFASTDGPGIAVAANSVTVDSGVQLSADQIELVAQQSIDLKSGATLSSTSGKNGTTLKTLPAMQTLALTDAGGNALPQAALLAVSDTNLPVVGRAPADGTAGATITLETGSTLSSGGALSLDAPGAVTLGGDIRGKGASWSLGSDSIAFVGSGTSTDTLNIGSRVLAELQQAGAVRLASGGAIDLLAPVSLGAASAGSAPTLKSLTLIGSSLNNTGNADSTFGAAELTLGGIGVGSASQGSVGGGTLSLVANDLVIGPGSLTVNGFARTVAQVGGAIETQGSGGLNVGGDLTLNAVELTSAPDASDPLGSTIKATGALTIGAPTALAAGTKLPTLVGGNLTLSANRIEDAGAIVVPSGLVTLDATGGDLHLTGTASIDASGRTVQVVNQSAASPGGAITLLAGGNVTLDGGSKISVAGAGAAPAGRLSIAGAGTVDVSSTLAGSANGNAGGSFTLNAGQSVNGLTALASKLSLGGFNNAIDLRVHSGDLDLAGTGTLTANSITLTADTGGIDIAGVLSAPSASRRGLIDLSAGTGVTLEAGAALHADGAGSAGRGGEIDINSTCPTCTITLRPGSVISTTGAAQMGQLVLRAPALGTSDAVGINVGTQGLGADVSRVGQVVIEPVTVFHETSSSINAGLSSDVNTAAGILSSTGSSIASRLTAGGTPVSVQAGVEIQSDDSLTLPSLDLSGFSQQGQVIDLTVRSAGSITINGTISDGVVADQVNRTGLPSLLNCVPGPCASGSLSFVAGADLGGANPLSTLAASSANLTLGSTRGPNNKIIPAVVRTGTGNLDLVAAGDVVFDSGAAAYTAGTAAAAAFVPSGGTTRLVNFGTGGGNVRIAAGADVVGSPVSGDGGNFSVTGWQVRQGNASTPAQYGIDLSAFDWNAGALGGGDVQVVAGGGIQNLSAAAADSLVAAANSPSGKATLVGAGGGVTLTAGGDIGSAQIFVADGTGTLTMGGGLTAIRSGSEGDPIGSSFALGNSQIAVWARQSVQVDAIYNPTYVPQAVRGVSNGSYFTYGPDSGLSLASTAGDVTLELVANKAFMGTLVGPNLISTGNAGSHFSYLPASLSIQALQQDIDLNLAGLGGVMYPSSTGQLALFAGQDINSAGAAFTMTDNLASSVPTPGSPGVNPVTGPGAIGELAKFQGNIHANDPTPALIAAGRDIVNFGLTVPKAGEVVAGRDIMDLAYQGQNLSPGDTTLISAGRDLTYTGTYGGIQVGGQGSLDVLSGRNINLGVADGITTNGNLKNVQLPSAAGADLNLMVGYGTQGADYAGFLQKIVVPSKTYQGELVSYAESLTGQSGLTLPQAEKAFAGFTTAQQSAFADKIFFNELLLSGRAANSGTGVGFAQGYAAIGALFPNGNGQDANTVNPYSGNLNLTSSQIYTLSGGSIAILVPGGKIDVGLANPPSNLIAKNPSQLGIVAEGTGDVSIYTQGDVNVNKSRVFTLGGGNILIWSNQGSIDAGNGSKSSLSVPPPAVLIDQNGTITVDYAGSLSAGSGIRTIQTNPGIPAGNVDLDAPVGTVNAGDAGIGAAGDVNIAAAHVIGIDNINFGGTAVGVPSDVSGLGASLSGVSAVASSSTSSATSSVSEANAAKETAPLAQTALSWLDVFVTGLGEENCKPDDIECLKRQKTASP